MSHGRLRPLCDLYRWVLCFKIVWLNVICEPLAVNFLTTVVDLPAGETESSSHVTMGCAGARRGRGRQRWNSKTFSLVQAVCSWNEKAYDSARRSLSGKLVVPLWIKKWVRNDIMSHNSLHYHYDSLPDSVHETDPLNKSR